jgi:hypothetical protein
VRFGDEKEYANAKGLYGLLNRKVLFSCNFLPKFSAGAGWRHDN